MWYALILGGILRFLDFPALKIIKINLNFNCTDMLLPIAVAIKPTHVAYEQGEWLPLCHQASHDDTGLSHSLCLIVNQKSPCVPTIFLYVLLLYGFQLAQRMYWKCFRLHLSRAIILDFYNLKSCWRNHIHF